MLEIEPTLQRLNRINPNFNFQNWCFDRVISEEEIPNLEYWKSLPTIEHKRHTVDLSKVIGTGHPDYPSKNWIVMLGNLKRCRSEFNYELCHDFFQNSNYSDSDFRYNKFGDIYIIQGGNHRTCIAKFIGIETLNAKVTEHFFDFELFNLHSDIRRLNIDFQSERVGRNVAIQFNFMKNSIRIVDFQLQKDFIAFYKNIEYDYFDDLKAKWYIYTKKNDFDRIIKLKSNKDFNKVFLELYVHKFLTAKQLSIRAN